MTGSPRSMLGAAARRWNSAVVWLRGDLADLPHLPPPGPVRLRDMDLGSEADVRLWLALANEAFGRRWGPGEYRRHVREHPHVAVVRTLFLLDGDRPVGMASIAHFRRNPEVGRGHYLALHPSLQGRGLGKWLSWHRYRLMRDQGYRICEAETTLERRRSLLLHFGAGFRPKARPDPWNTPDESSPFLRALTDHRLRRLWRQWRRRHPRTGGTISTADLPGARSRA